MLRTYLRALSRSIFFFNHTATTAIYTLSLHDALPILHWSETNAFGGPLSDGADQFVGVTIHHVPVVHLLRIRRAMTEDGRSEEHTSELQSRENLVCRLLLEKKKRIQEHDLQAGRHRRS